MTVQGHLERAANYIDEFGWKQHWQAKYGEPACILRAIQLTAINHEYMDAYLAVQDRLGRPWTALGEWNDAKGRTKAEVLAVLRGKA